MTDYPIRHLDSNPSLDGFARLIPDIVYTSDREEALTLQLLQPWGLYDANNEPRLYPAVVFVQGSSWTNPDVNLQLPQLSQLARRGYVVATVTHRSAKDGHRAPAFLKDVKTAIRYLRAHAVELHLDPERLGIWGTSSGANAALLTGLCPDEPALTTREWPGQSDAVRYVVDCFGPADADLMLQEIQSVVNQVAELAGIPPELLPEFAESEPLHELQEARKMAQAFIGSADGGLDMELVKLISPIDQIKPGRSYPPFLIVHGDQDDVVSYQQSLNLYQALKLHGTHAEMICVEGAGHEGSFWSQEVLELIWSFIDQHSNSEK